MQGQLNIFDVTLPEFKTDKPIRLIELFAGIGSHSAMPYISLFTKFLYHMSKEAGTAVGAFSSRRKEIE